MSREQLDSLITTHMIGGKRSTRKQREKMMHGLTKMLSEGEHQMR